jgi:hypothetical protein
MKERILTKEEQILVLETKIAERALIIYVDESAIADITQVDERDDAYVAALQDEIENHKTIMEEYKESLKQLQK